MKRVHIVTTDLWWRGCTSSQLTFDEEGAHRHNWPLMKRVHIVTTDLWWRGCTSSQLTFDEEGAHRHRLTFDEEGAHRHNWPLMKRVHIVTDWPLMKRVHIVTDWPLMKRVPERSCVKRYWKSMGRPSALLHVILGAGSPLAAHGREAFCRMSTPMEVGMAVITGAATTGGRVTITGGGYSRGQGNYNRGRLQQGTG